MAFGLGFTWEIISTHIPSTNLLVFLVTVILYTDFIIKIYQLILSLLYQLFGFRYMFLMEASIIFILLCTLMTLRCTLEVVFHTFLVIRRTSEVRFPTFKVQFPTLEMAFRTYFIRPSTSEVRFLIIEVRRSISEVCYLIIKARLLLFWV